MCIYWRGEWQTLHYFWLENPMNSMKKQKGMTPRDGLLRSVGGQYASRHEWRTSSRKNEEAEPKRRQHPVMDVTGDGGEVWCCKEHYCIRIWNVRSMNQGKLEVAKQEMATVNIGILRISKLKWTGMGEFNLDDYYIYCWRQESLRRNGVALIVNRASRVAQLVKNPPAMWEAWVQSLGWEDPLEKGEATHCSILPWRIPWTIQSVGLQRIRHSWATFTFTHSQQRVWNAVLRCSRKSGKMISVHFRGKPFHITVIQLYAPTTNTKEAEVEWFYEGLEDFLELTPKKRCPFHHRGLECNSRKSGDTWSNRQIWPWSTKWSRAKANSFVKIMHWS